MKSWLLRSKEGHMLLFIMGVIIIPNIIEEVLTRMFQWKFENPIWYEVVDTSIMLVVSIPVFWVLISKLNDYVYRMESLIIQNGHINEILRTKNAELELVAYYDELTGLPNRFKLFEDLDERIRQADARNLEDETIAVAFLDLDRFKHVNDTIGHLSGDELIRHLSRRVNNALPAGYELYWHGADECIILGQNRTRYENINLAQRLLKLIAKPFYINDEEIYITASMGISLYPEDGREAETLVKKADQALYIAKGKGGGQFQFFTPIMNANAIRRMKLENGLRNAVDNDELILYYQPQIDLKTKEIKGMEALIRWNHPELGLVPPNEFIPLAEETGAIIPIGRWVVETACCQLKKWHEAGRPDLTVAVNVSTKQLKRHAFPDFISTVLQRTKLSPEHLQIEVTESMMQDIEESSKVFNQLKQLGVKISIDDFGTGFASLSVLSYLPIDYLKIDQAFIRDMYENIKTKSIVKTIIQLGHNLGVELVAEGIEEPQQAAKVMAYGCHYGQGYLYSRPLPAEELAGLLEANRVSV